MEEDCCVGGVAREGAVAVGSQGIKLRSGREMYWLAAALAAVATYAGPAD